MEQALLEAAAIDFAVTAVPFALAMPLAIEKRTGIPTAVGVVDPALALQQTIHHLSTVTTAIGQASVGRGKGLAIAAGGDQ